MMFGYSNVKDHQLRIHAGVERANRNFTESNVLIGLRHVWADATGNDERFDANTRIDVYMKADGSWDEIDLADVFFRLDKYFGQRHSLQEWTDFCGGTSMTVEEWECQVAPGFTFGALARFIAERGSEIPCAYDDTAALLAALEPIDIAGQRSVPAGIFTGLHAIARHSGSRLEKFGPSTRIADVLRGGRLARFWGTTRFLTEDAIPQLPDFWRYMTWGTGCVGLFASVFAMLALDRSQWMIVWFFALLTEAAAVGFQRKINPLPEHIQTFRDLACVIAESRV